MDESELTLEELAERSGVEPRTLRSWVSEGLLSPPYKPGRGARYPATNADRALAVRALKDIHGLSMSEIGRRFMMTTENQIREWALEMSPASAPPGSARDYLSRIQAHSAKSKSTAPLPMADGEPSTSSPKLPLACSPTPPVSAPRQNGDERPEDLANIEQLILQLEKVVAAPASKRSRGMIWTRIAVTPDLELSVRGDLEPRERILFEQLADQFRAILTGRTSYD